MNKKVFSIDGVVVLTIALCILGRGLYLTFNNFDTDSFGWLASPIYWLSAATLLLSGLKAVLPNEARLYTFFGNFQGSLTKGGLQWIVPFFNGKAVSLKKENIQTAVLKVNDKNGNPIEISALITGQVSDPYKSAFDVEDYQVFIKNQFEVGLRDFAKSHTYSELTTDHEADFIGNLQKMVAVAGFTIEATKVTHLNYAPEIASAMLQKQQAASMSEAKETIVEAAVEMAKTAAVKISGLSETEKAQFAAKLVIVLCSDRGVSPIIDLS